jgi:hypothetical protein
MPMNPILAATLRRNWPIVGAIGFFVLFWLGNQLFFRPAAKRYAVAYQQAIDLGLALDPSRAAAMLPPRVFALVADNTLVAAQAQEQGNSGVLTAKLLEELTRSIHDHGMDVVATEPGAVTQQSRSVQVRAYLKVHGRYGQLVSLLDDLAHRRELIALDRFTLSAPPNSPEVLELWVSRYILKQDKVAR